uniref:Putative heparan n-sulfatase n=1 Tax=Ixodes ricinus TaxID=34613 RepID=A0A6B0UTC6_IXORI
MAALEIASVKEISTAKPSQEYSEAISTSATSAPSTTRYKILLPSLPNGKLLENSPILHKDPSARPYRIDDFGPALKKIINPNELASLGAFQYNHLWLLTVRSAKEKERLLQLREIRVKNKTCSIIDGSKTGAVHEGALDSN